MDLELKIKMKSMFYRRDNLRLIQISAGKPLKIQSKTYICLIVS
jgi:hypothetical protein